MPEHLRDEQAGIEALRYRLMSGVALLMMALCLIVMVSAILTQNQIALIIGGLGMVCGATVYYFHVRGSSHVASILALLAINIILSVIGYLLNYRANLVLYCILPLLVLYLFYGTQSSWLLIVWSIVATIPYLIWGYGHQFSSFFEYPPNYSIRFWHLFNYVMTMTFISAILYLFSKEQKRSRTIMAEQLTMIDTHRKQLADSEANLNAIVLSLNDVVFQVDQQHIIRSVWASKTFSLYRDATSARGKHIAHVFPAGLLSVLESALHSAFSVEHSQSIEYYFAPQQEWYLFKIAPVAVESGVEQSSVFVERSASIVVSNITDSKTRDERVMELNRQFAELNEELEARVIERTKEVDDSKMELQIQVVERWMAEQRLAEALGREHTFNEMKTHLIQMLSHQFRTPLTYIQNGFDFIAYANKHNKPMSPERMHRTMNSVNQGIEQIVGLIDGVTSLMSIQTELLSENATDCDITMIMKEAVQMLSTVPDINERLDVKIQGTPVAQTIAGAVRITVREMIKNALMYSPAHTPVEVYVEEDLIDFEGLESVGIRITVNDHGKGVPHGEEKRIFDYFYRAGEQSAVGGDRALGIGLGLGAFCVRLLRGSIRYQPPTNDTGHATQFILEFPQFMTT